MDALSTRHAARMVGACRTVCVSATRDGMELLVKRAFLVTLVRLVSISATTKSSVTIVACVPTSLVSAVATAMQQARHVMSVPYILRATTVTLGATGKRRAMHMEGALATARASAWRDIRACIVMSALLVTLDPIAKTLVKRMSPAAGMEGETESFTLCCVVFHTSCSLSGLSST